VSNEAIAFICLGVAALATIALVLVVSL